MALIGRVARLLRADLHALLDQLEEPETLLRQAMREMEESLARDKQACKHLLHEQEMLEQREQEIRKSFTNGGDELDLCFESGQEALARDLIRRRLEAAGLAKALAAKRSRLATHCAELKAAIEQNQSRLEDIRQKSELLCVETTHRRSQEEWPAMEVQIREQEVELELLKEKQKRGLS